MRKLIQITLLFIAFAIVSTFQLSDAESSVDNLLKRSNTDENEDALEQQRQEYEFKKLRQYLLTSKAEERAERRKQQDAYRRELIREYLKALTDSDTNKFEEVKKRFCASYVEFYANQAACLG